METLWFGWGIKEAIDHRRLHHQLLPKEIQAEDGFPEVTAITCCSSLYKTQVHRGNGNYMLF